MKPKSTTFGMGRGGRGKEQGGCWLEPEVMGLEGTGRQEAGNAGVCAGSGVRGGEHRHRSPTGQNLNLALPHHT